jgi:hypothetical protein
MPQAQPISTTLLSGDSPAKSITSWSICPPICSQPRRGKTEIVRAGPELVVRQPASIGSVADNVVDDRLRPALRLVG